MLAFLSVKPLKCICYEENFKMHINFQKNGEMPPWYFGSIWTSGIELALRYLDLRTLERLGQDVSFLIEIVLKSGLWVKDYRKRKLKLKFWETSPFIGNTTIYLQMTKGKWPGKQEKKRNQYSWRPGKREWLTPFWYTDRLASLLLPQRVLVVLTN